MCSLSLRPALIRYYDREDRPKHEGRVWWQIRAVVFLLILSKAQTGLILRKVFEGRRRYERTLDFGNGSTGLRN
jgi:hypothetical protein